MEDPGHLARNLEMCTWIWQKSWNVHQHSAAFNTKLLNKRLYLEMEDVGHLAKLRTWTTQLSKLHFWIRVCIWKWRIWDTWPKSWNVHLDSTAFKTKLLNKRLYLEMDDMGHLAKLRTWVTQPSKLHFWIRVCIWKWRTWDTWQEILKCAPGLLSLQK